MFADPERERDILLAQAVRAMVAAGGVDRSWYNRAAVGSVIGLFSEKSELVHRRVAAKHG
jgi:polyphosphate kinase 2 (PPK2 family)